MKLKSQYCPQPNKTFTNDNNKKLEPLNRT